MLLIDYTHPGKVPSLHLAHDRRSADWYLRLDQLPAAHPFASGKWALFRYDLWLEGGSAWVQAKSIVEDLIAYLKKNELDSETVRPVIGSDDPEFDEAIAQALITFGASPLVAEVSSQK